MARARRVDQLLSSLGYCSRREAQGLCDEGRVTVDSVQVARAAERAEPALVRVDGEPLEFPEGLFIMLNKPVGFVCSHDERDGRLVYELLPPRWRLRDPVVTTVGRLDKDTSGLLLLTDDGARVHQLTSPRHHVDKVYVATVDGEITAEIVARFAAGLTLDDGPAAPARLEVRAPRLAAVTLQEGRYHQVRRMFAACGLLVTTLHRERLGEWTLGELAPGQWRALA
jgi:16S rRNA pseudouridine516 synthase